MTDNVSSIKLIANTNDNTFVFLPKRVYIANVANGKRPASVNITMLIVLSASLKFDFLV